MFAAYFVVCMLYCFVFSDWLMLYCGYFCFRCGCDGFTVLLLNFACYAFVCVL